MMTYKGYTGVVEMNEDAGLFHGEIIDVKDVITFQGRTVKELKKAFHDSVDDYLVFCNERGEDPDKPFSGNFTVRLTPEQHHAAYLAAKKSRKSLNAWVTELIGKAGMI